MLKTAAPENRRSYLGQPPQSVHRSKEARGECKEVESDSVLCKNENKAATGVSKGSPPQDDTELAWAAGAAKAITQGTEGRTAKGHKLQRAPTRSREQVPSLPLEAPCKPAFPFVPPKTHFRLLPKMELWLFGCYISWPGRPLG